MEPKRARAARRGRRSQRPANNWSLLVVGLGAVVATAGLWLVFDSSDDADEESTLVTPASSSSAAVSVAGVQVAVPSVDLGRIPLDTPVKHSFQLRNTGLQRATLGRARIEVLEGC